MSEKKFYKEQSKRDFYSEGAITHEDIKTGCLQRIASATELMSKSYATMAADLQRMKESREYYQNQNEKLHRRISSLKGVITKQKKAKV